MKTAILVPTPVLHFLSLALALCLIPSTGEELSCDLEGQCVNEQPRSILDDEPLDCTDKEVECEFWAQAGECSANPVYMLDQCAKACQVCVLGHTKHYGKLQTLKDEKDIEQLQLTHNYMKAVYVNETLSHVKYKCKNQHSDCVHWAALGECQANPSYMILNCAPACQTCELLDYETRCPMNDLSPNTWNDAGELDTFFESILDRALPYQPTIFSGPGALIDKHRHANITVPSDVIRDGPWVVTLENVFSEEECQHLIDWGHKVGYERSQDVGGLKDDGTLDSVTNPKRTSTNAWCADDCYKDERVNELHSRMDWLTGLPRNNSEYWQILKYEPSQYYQEHHDYISHELDRQEGVRILTVFLYLNTVPEGGGTRFTQLDLTVQPVRGRVLLWPSVLTNEPHKDDPRTEHTALAVIDGVKYGANAWYHQRDFKKPHEIGCT